MNERTEIIQLINSHRREEEKESLMTDLPLIQTQGSDLHVSIREKRAMIILKLAID